MTGRAAAEPSIRGRTLFYVSPLGTVFLIGRGIGIGVPPLAIILWQIAWELSKFVVRFARTLFILIHSKELVLVSVDTALGVLTTYLLFVRQGEPVLGVGPTIVLSGLVSVVFGVLHYQVVSRRVLHLNGREN